MSLTRAQLAECAALRKQEVSFAVLAGRYGVSAPTLCRLMQRHESNGGDEKATLAKAYATGPRDEHQLTNEEIRVLKLGVIENRSRRLAAMKLLASAACQEDTHAKLSAVFDRAAETRMDEQFPKWFTRACIVTDEERLAFRGSKAFESVNGARRRGAFVRVEGEDVPLVPNALWIFDDESENRMRAELDEAGKVRLNRQTLKAMDVAAAFFLGGMNIDRDSDGYRLEDQARFFLELVDAHGLPQRVGLEKGPWDNNFWLGIPQKREWWQTKECVNYRFGGIDVNAGGPCQVIQFTTSRQKGLIEGAFNHRQNLDAHKTLDMGRFRGEHELAAKHISRARAGQMDAFAKFPEAGISADISAETMEEFNDEAKRRAYLYGPRKVVPSELYAEAVKRELPASERWRFLPVKVAVTVRNMHIAVKVPRHDIPFQFSAEGFKPQWDSQPWLPHGWRVFACFDPQRLDVGCHIFNALHPDHPQNPGRYPLGMPLGVLPFAPLAPQASDEAPDMTGRAQTVKYIRSEVRIMKAMRKTIRVSTTVQAGRTRTARIGSPDPLAPLNLESGAPPVGAPDGMPAAHFGDARSGADHTTGSGERAARGGLDHEARPKNSAGRLQFTPVTSKRDAALAALEALEANL